MPGSMQMPQESSGAPEGAMPPSSDVVPSGTPSGSPVAPEGEMEMAKANVQIAIAMLERQLPLLGTDTEEGKAILQALNTLSRKFSGQKSEDLAPAELMNVMAGVPDHMQKQMMAEMGPGKPIGTQVP